jgi:hypothetical protein
LCTSDADCFAIERCNGPQNELLGLRGTCELAFQQQLFCEDNEDCPSAQFGPMACDTQNSECVLLAGGTSCESNVPCRSSESCVADENGALTCVIAAEPGRCDLSNPCPDGETCDVRVGRCVAVSGGSPCGLDDDCRSTELCVQGVCAATPSCALDRDCGDATLTCDTVSGQCARRGTLCTDNGDCVGTQVCNTDVGRCAPIGTACRNTADCFGGLVCSLGACRLP